MERTLAFYRALGVDVAEPWQTASGIHHASANQDGGPDLDFDSAAFAQVWNEGWNGRADLAGRVVVVFKVAGREDVDERYAALVGAGYQGLQAPYDTFWGARYAIVEGPDGVAVGLMSPVDPAKRSRPPEV